MIELKQVSKAYGPVTAVRQVSLAVQAGEILALLGPSGCGKTTTLRLIAGLEAPDHGEVWLGGRLVAGGGRWVPPEGRGLGLVFQDGALFPHMRVGENVGFGIEDRPAAERRARVAELLALVGLSGLEQRATDELSGGQQQRVALARALARGPQILLLDEPFASLDAALRRTLRAEVIAVIRASGATAVFVTHDQEEALSSADRVAVMFAGEIAQLGTPQQVYARPASLTVARFVGEANVLPGVAAGRSARCALGEVALVDAAEGPVAVMARPEQIALAGGAAWQIERVTFFGAEQAVVCARDGVRVSVRVPGARAIQVGARAELRVDGPVVAFAGAMP